MKWPPNACTYGHPVGPDGQTSLCETAPMFRHHHDPETVAERIDRLMVAVLISDRDERLHAIASQVTADFVYMSPQTVVDGAEGISDAFARFRHDVPSTTLIRRTSDVDEHHDHFRYTWERSEYGRLAMEGCSFGWTDATGLISQIVSFDGLTIGPTT